MKTKHKRLRPLSLVSYVLKRCALERGWTLAELAHEMGVAPSTLTRWQRIGHMPLTKASWLERKFGREIVPVRRITRRR